MAAERGATLHGRLLDVAERFPAREAFVDEQGRAVIADPERLRQLDLAVLEMRRREVRDLRCEELAYQVIPVRHNSAGVRYVAEFVRIDGD